MIHCWMPSARPSATAMITISSTTELRVMAANLLMRTPADPSRLPPASRRRVAGGHASRRVVTSVGGDIGSGLRRRLGLVPGSGLVVLAPPLDLYLYLTRGVLGRRRVRLLRARVLPGSARPGALLDSAPRRGALEHRLLRGHAICVSRAVGPDRLGIGQQAGLDHLLRTGVAALAHPRALTYAIAQVVELRAAHVTACGQLDSLDLRRVHREHSLDTNAERLLADRESLARAMPLALDHDALEDLHTATGALDHLEMDLHAIARREVGNAAQLRALDGFDNAAHE